MTLFYDKRNRENLAKLAINTRAAALKWYEFCVKNNINILIHETIRTEVKQKEYVASGASKTMRSYHLVGQALDFVPVDEKGQAHWDWYGKADIKKAIIFAKSLRFEWGGDWAFVDKPHLQFKYKGYGTDTFDCPSTIVAIPGNSKVSEFQLWLNTTYKAGLKTDGLYGPKTKTAALKGLQTELNNQYNARLVIDGIWGSKTKAAVQSVRKGARGNTVKIVQGMLHCLGFNPGNLDGIFGAGTASAVLAFQKDRKLTQDAIAGKITFEKLFT